MWLSFVLGSRVVCGFVFFFVVSWGGFFVSEMKLKILR